MPEFLVAVSPELAATLNDAVAHGEYASADEAIREALQEWLDRRACIEPDVEMLRRLWDEGIASGPPTDLNTVFDRVRVRIRGRDAAE